MAYMTLKKLKTRYSQIHYMVVLAYMPGARYAFDTTDYTKAIYPEGLENTPSKFAISKRNRWLVEHNDTVITYVTHSFGGAAQFKELANRKGKWTINLADDAE